MLFPASELSLSFSQSYIFPAEINTGAMLAYQKSVAKESPRVYTRDFSPTKCLVQASLLPIIPADSRLKIRPQCCPFCKGTPSGIIELLLECDYRLCSIRRPFQKKLPPPPPKKKKSTGSCSGCNKGDFIPNLHFC